MRILRITALVFALVLASVSVSSAEIVNLTFSGNYDILGSAPFSSGTNAFSYTMTYDTSLDTNTQFFDVGASLGSTTTTHQWYGYSVSGVTASNFTFGTKTFPTSSISAMIPAAGVSADIWFDTDISTTAPTLTWFFFSDGDGNMQLGGGASDGTNTFMYDGSSITDFSSFEDGFTNSMTIGFSPVPEPSTFAMFGIACTVFTRRRRS